MFSLQSFENKLSLDGINNVNSIDNHVIFDNESLIFRKPNDSITNYVGKKNVVSGFNAGKNIRRGNENVLIGHSAGLNTNTSTTNTNLTHLASHNVFLGTNAGKNNVDGYSNIFIGHNNSHSVDNIFRTTNLTTLFNNVGIGSDGQASGGNTIAIGNKTLTKATNSTTIGHRSSISENATNSLIIGNRITNGGRNAFIIRANGSNQSVNFLPKSNVTDNYFNVNDVFEGISGETIYVNDNLQFRKNAIFEGQMNADSIDVTHARIDHVFGDVVFGSTTTDDQVTFKSKTSFEDRVEFYNHVGMYSSIELIGSSRINAYDDKFNLNSSELRCDLPTTLSNVNINSASVSNIFVGSNIEVEGTITLNGRNLFEVLANNDEDNTFIVQINDIIGWLHENQNDVDLKEFNNNLAPWLRYHQSNVNLSSFNNDIANWLVSDQSNIRLSGFSNDFAPWIKYDSSTIDLTAFSNNLAPWLAFNQEDVKLSSFSNDLARWLRPDSMSIPLSSFFNDIASWLNETQSDIPFSGFCNDVAPWLRPRQDSVSLSNFDNDLAPWLKYHSSDIPMTGFLNDLAPWLRYDQSNVRLRYFLNDIAPWLDEAYYASNVMISIFTHDSLNVQSNSYFNSNVHFYDDVYFHDNIHFADSNKDFVVDGDAVFNGTVTISNLSVTDDLVIEDDLDVNGTFTTHSNSVFNGPTVLHNDFTVYNNDDEVIFSIVDSNVIINGTLDILGGGFFDQNSNGISISNDLFVDGNITCKGAFICGSITIQPYEEYYRVIEMALSNLEDYTQLDHGLALPGAYFTPHENVFFKPTYFLDEVFFTCNPFKLDPIVYLDFFAKCNLYVGDHLYGSEYTCNLLIGSDTYFEQEATFKSNVFFEGCVFGRDSNDILNVCSETIFHSNVTICNNLTVHGDVYALSSNEITFFSETAFEYNVYLKENLFTSNNVYIYPNDSNNTSLWRMFSQPSPDNSNEADLYFVSKNGAAMAISDNFEESVINFTGQHRCSFNFNFNLGNEQTVNETPLNTSDNLVGKIVRSTGEYNDLYNSKIIRINEAIPVVELCTIPYDKAVFGVVSGEESDDSSRCFNIGNLKFFLDNKTKIKKVMVNSVGEGGIWVCNINGPLHNGDYITTCTIPGLGSLQTDVDESHKPDLTMRNYTVAKITCDCTFDLDSDIYVCETFCFDNTYYKKAFVGCVYYC